MTNKSGNDPQISLWQLMLCRNVVLKVTRTSVMLCGSRVVPLLCEWQTGRRGFFFFQIFSRLWQKFTQFFQTTFPGNRDDWRSLTFRNKAVKIPKLMNGPNQSPRVRHTAVGHKITDNGLLKKIIQHNFHKFRQGTNSVAPKPISNINPHDIGACAHNKSMRRLTTPVEKYWKKVANASLSQTESQLAGVTRSPNHW